jgi:DNA polymerase-3 subunit beta
MYFTCSKSELLTAIATVARAASKMQKSILECILFTGEDGAITLKATDIAISIKTKLAANVEKEGTAAIPARVLHEIINRFPESDVTFESIGENSMEISCLNSKVVLQQMDPDEFPAFPEIEKDVQVKIPQNLMRKMINSTIFSVAVTEDKPILTGLMFDIKEGSLNLVGLDGYRMAVSRESVISEKDASCVIPARTLREVSRIISDSDENVKVAISGNMALFEVDDTQIYTRLLEGDFVNYENLLPKDYTTSIKVETEMLKDSIERASILAREGSNNVIKFVVQGDMLEVTSNSEMGNIDEKIHVATEGKDIKIAFNAKYLLDVIRA